MEKVICQSCAMPMNDEKLFGTNKDGSVNKEYCTYCYKEGEFTSDVSMEQMVEICVPHIVREDGMKEEEARNLMNGLLPNLKRWKK